MSIIKFKTKLFKIHDWSILQLPKSASEKLPSRGLVLVEGTINDFQFRAPLEPDGKGSHWLRIDNALRKGTKADADDTVTVAIESSKDWPEPEVPQDIKKALEAHPSAQELWLDTTTKARWDWIRWIRSTKNPDTRKIRIEKTVSKLNDGKRRPCCFNQSMCTEPYVSKSGILLEPTA